MALRVLTEGSRLTAATEALSPEGGPSPEIIIVGLRSRERFCCPLSPSRLFTLRLSQTLQNLDSSFSSCTHCRYTSRLAQSGRCHNLSATNCFLRRLKMYLPLPPGAIRTHYCPYLHSASSKGSDVNAQAGNSVHTAAYRIQPSSAPIQLADL
jgi:hypothetical protein